MLLIALLGQALSVVECSRFSNTSTRLRSGLLTSYDKEVRPEMTTSVQLTLVITSLDKLDTASQSMGITALWFTIWQDERLRWDPNVYDDITSLAMNKKEVWVPPLVVTNEVDDVGLIGNENVPLRAFSTGLILWIPPSSLETSCQIDVSNYPFDIQTCTINVTGWTLAADEMDLQIPSEPISIDLYSENGEWELIKRSALSSDFDGGFDKRYRTLRYSLTFRRLWPFYGLTLLCPLALSSLLMAGVFAVPVDSGEKLGYSLTVLLSFTVLLTLISDSLPAISTQISALQVYLSIVLILGSVVTTMTILILLVHHKKHQKPLPRFFAVTYKVMACLVCHKKRWETRTITPAPTEALYPETGSRFFRSKRSTAHAWTRNDNSDASDDDMVTWQDFAQCLDSVCLRFFTVTFVVLISVFLGYMYSVYYSWY